MKNLAVACLLAWAAIGLLAQNAVAARPGFVLAMDEPAVQQPDRADAAYARIDELGVSRVRVNLSWANSAPAGAAAPDGFNARDPADARYRWTAFDATVRRAAAAGRELLVTVSGAPAWAQRPGARPDDIAPSGYHVNAAAYADFAYAAALRYNGRFPDPLTAGATLPRVRIWQAWNEPNLPSFLYPATPEHYLPLLNGFYDAVKSVDGTNFVVAAGLAPVKSSKPASYPLRFAAEMLCLRREGPFRDQRFSAGGCKRPPARFDALSIHPYSLMAKPGQHAAYDGNVFVADVPVLARMLRVAERSHLTHVPRPPLWVTEFAWFTNPPNKSVGDPPRIAAARAMEALYRLWSAGVSCVTWSLLYDASGGLVPGGGLLYADGSEKPTFDALRIPLFVGRSGGRTVFWGRGPSPRTPVTIRTLRGRLVRTAPTDADGVFSFSVRGKVRARLQASQGAVQSLSALPRDIARGRAG
ncbi:MAG: hypothetical protein HY827_07100 [Actinobacteria bacterium]|nr:hypothetical protein [Actinomycetota bacterium]